MPERKHGETGPQYECSGPCPTNNMSQNVLSHSRKIFHTADILEAHCVLSSTWKDVSLKGHCTEQMGHGDLVCINSISFYLFCFGGFLT